jgi:hypothetical protein
MIALSVASTAFCLWFLLLWLSARKRIWQLRSYSSTLHECLDTSYEHKDRMRDVHRCEVKRLKHEIACHKANCDVKTALLNNKEETYNWIEEVIKSYASDLNEFIRRREEERRPASEANDRQGQPEQAPPF